MASNKKLVKVFCMYLTTEQYIGQTLLSNRSSEMCPLVSDYSFDLSVYDVD